jgi:hypothetical protein
MKNVSPSAGWKRQSFEFRITINTIAIAVAAPFVFKSK